MKIFVCLLVLISISMAYGQYCAHRPEQHCTDLHDYSKTSNAEAFWSEFSCQSVKGAAESGAPCYSAPSTGAAQFNLGNPSSPFEDELGLRDETWVNSLGLEDDAWSQLDEAKRENGAASTDNWGKVGHIAVYETGNGWPFVINHGFLRYFGDEFDSYELAGAPRQNFASLSKNARWTVCTSPDCSSTRPVQGFSSNHGETYFNWSPCGSGKPIYLWVAGTKRLAFAGVASSSVWTDGRVAYAICTDAACSDVMIRSVGAENPDLPNVEHQCVGGKFGVGVRLAVGSDGNPTLMWRNAYNPSETVFVHCGDYSCSTIASRQIFTLDAERIDPTLYDDFTQFQSAGGDQIEEQYQTNWWRQPALWWDFVSSEHGSWIVSLHQSRRSHYDHDSFIQITMCNDKGCDTSSNGASQFPQESTAQTESLQSRKAFEDLDEIVANGGNPIAESENNLLRYDRNRPETWGKTSGWVWETNEYKKGNAYSFGFTDSSQNRYFSELEIAKIRESTLRQRAFIPVAGDVAWAYQAYSAGLSGNGYPMWVGQAKYQDENLVSWMVCSCTDDACSSPSCHQLESSKTIGDFALNHCLEFEDSLPNVESDHVPTKGHFSSRHRVLNGASNGLPIIVSHISSFCLKLEGDQSTDVYGFTYGARGEMDVYKDYSPFELSQAAVSNRRILLQSSKASYFSCLDSDCSSASVSRLMPSRIPTVLREAGWNQVDTTFVQPENILTLYAPDVTPYQLSSSSQRTSFKHPENDGSADTIINDHPWNENLPVWYLVHEYSDFVINPRTAGFKTWLTNRWSSPNGNPCNLENAGQTVAADDVVFVCTSVEHSSNPNQVALYEWVELGWGLRWRWFNDIHLHTGSDYDNDGLEALWDSAFENANDAQIGYCISNEQDENLVNRCEWQVTEYNITNGFRGFTDYHYIVGAIGTEPRYGSEYELIDTTTLETDFVIDNPTTFWITDLHANNNYLWACSDSDVPMAVYDVNGDEIGRCENRDEFDVAQWFSACGDSNAGCLIDISETNAGDDIRVVYGNNGFRSWDQGARTVPFFLSDTTPLEGPPTRWWDGNNYIFPSGEVRVTAGTDPVIP